MHLLYILYTFAYILLIILEMKGTDAGVVLIFFGGTVWVLSYSSVPYVRVFQTAKG